MDCTPSYLSWEHGLKESAVTVCFKNKIVLFIVETPAEIIVRHDARDRMDGSRTQGPPHQGQ